jgi:hypothetical protein
MAEVDWAALMPLLRAGDWTCVEHGRIQPVRFGQLPTCPDCGRLAHRVSFTRSGMIQFVEPSPARCEGPERHRFGPNLVLLAWSGCDCPAARANHGGHRSWACRRCPSEIFFPPCGAPRRPRGFIPADPAHYR